MNITESKQGSVYTFALAGELDTTTASQLEERLESIDGDVTEIIFDFTELDIFPINLPQQITQVTVFGSGN